MKHEIVSLGRHLRGRLFASGPVRLLVLLPGLLGARASAQRLSLHQAVQEALTSPQAEAAVARTDEVRGQLRQDRLGLNPRLYLQSEDWRPWGDGFDYGSQTENYAFLSQTLETDRKRSKRIGLGLAQVREAEAVEQEARLGLAGRVAGAYFNAVVLGRTATLLREDMQAVDEMVHYHRERVAAGAMRGVDLLRMQIERDRLEMALEAAERDAVQARLELFKQMGRPPEASVELTDSVEAVLDVTPVPVETVLAHRPDLLQAREAVAAADADLKVQHARAVPDLDLVGGYKRNNSFNTGYAALQVDLPFRNRNQGEIERAEASKRLAERQLAVVELQARAEIAQSEENLHRAQRLVQQLLPDMRGKAQENLRLMTAAYRLGGVDLLRYLDAQRTAFEVEVNALRSFADLQQAALRLRLSYGEQP